MPAVFSHYYMAQHTKNVCAVPCGMVRDAFNWGAQGPDVLYYSKGIKPRASLRKCGVLMHHIDPALLFETFFDIYNAGGYSEIALSYIQGFICHYTLDRSAHPYIYYLSQQLVTRDDILSIFIHNRIEHNIDVLVLLKEKHVGGDKICAVSVLPANREVLFEVSAFLTEVMRRMFKKRARRINQKRVFRCFKGSRQMARLLFDRTGRKQKIYRRIERVLDIGPAFSGIIRPKEPDNGIDYTNSLNTPWYYLDDMVKGSDDTPPHTESYFDMEATAIQDAADMIYRFNECLENGKYTDFTGHLGFTTGRPVYLRGV